MAPDQASDAEAILLFGLLAIPPVIMFAIDVGVNEFVAADGKNRNLTILGALRTVPDVTEVAVTTMMLVMTAPKSRN